MQVYPNSGALAIAGLVQTALVGAKLRLFLNNVGVVGPTTTRQELINDEADFTGYPAGGAEIEAFMNPLLNPAGGASIDWPTVQFASASPYTVGNVIGGWWVETAGGQMIACGTFPAGIPIGGAGTGFPLSGSLVFPNGG